MLVFCEEIVIIVGLSRANRSIIISRVDCVAVAVKAMILTHSGMMLLMFLISANAVWNSSPHLCIQCASSITIAMRFSLYIGCRSILRYFLLSRRFLDLYKLTVICL